MSASLGLLGVRLSLPGSEGGLVPQEPVAQRVCSPGCFDRWAWGYIIQGFEPLPVGQYLSLGGVYLEAQMAARAKAMADTRLRYLRLRRARQLLDAENFEGAAQIFESLNMWKEAGEARRRTRHQVVTHVQVNLNDLIEQMRRGGITTIYTCPGCGGPIHISGSTNPGALGNCQYCGAAVQTTDLVDFLSRMVGG